MQKKITINDSELPIMKVLWKKSGITSPEILAQLRGNKSTLKTLLGRLVGRGAVRVEELTQRSYRYFAVISEVEYIVGQRRNFLQKVFDGSAEKMLLNFVREENISPEDLRGLLDQIEEEGQHGAREFSAGIVPAAITYREEADGYALIEYKESGMGGEWESSIRKYCVLPSGRPIRGLADKIINDYRDHSALEKIQQQKRDAYLAAHGLRMMPHQLGETKRFQYNKLVLEITNVAYSETKTGLDHGTDPYDYSVYTLYPGAQLNVINADMLDDSLTEDGQARGRYYAFDASRIYSEQPEEYVFLTDGMKLALTPDVTHVGIDMVGVLRFEWVDETSTEKQPSAAMHTCCRLLSRQYKFPCPTREPGATNPHNYGESISEEKHSTDLKTGLAESQGSW